MSTGRLTTSDARSDAAAAYDEHANGYLVKPIEFNDFKRMMDELEFYWLGWNYYPWKEQEA